jgi:hypothetical protein
LCELGFSALLDINSKKRERLKTFDDEMPVCLKFVPLFKINAGCTSPVFYVKGAGCAIN